MILQNRKWRGENTFCALNKVTVRFESANEEVLVAFKQKWLGGGW